MFQPRIAGLLPALAGLFALAATSAPLAADTYRLDRLLDPQVAPEVRLSELAAVKSLADGGEHSAICLLGRLGVQRAHPATLKDADYGDPAAYLNRCVLGGDLDAMLVMTELELRARRPLEASIWIQSYLKLAGTLGAEVVNSASAYKAGLLARIDREFAGRRPPNEEILEYVAGFLHNHGERILQACRAGGCDQSPRLPPQPPGELRMLKSGKSLAGRYHRDSKSAEDQLVYAVFLLQIDASGKPTPLVIEAYPDFRAARELNGHALSRRFNAIEPGSGTRYAVLPVFMDNKAYDLMPDASPRHRGRR